MVLSSHSLLTPSLSLCRSRSRALSLSSLPSTLSQNPECVSRILVCWCADTRMCVCLCHRSCVIKCVGVCSCVCGGGGLRGILEAFSKSSLRWQRGKGKGGGEKGGGTRQTAMDSNLGGTHGVASIRTLPMFVWCCFLSMSACFLSCI